MGKHRVRPKSGKAVKWGKGQSCVSNPSSTKHRAKAKPMFFQHLNGDVTGSMEGAGKLTEAALMRHEALQGDADDMQSGLNKMSIGEDETLSLGMTAKTFDTFASDWTQCTNIAFDKLMKKFQLKNAHHKEMLAVLAAITEILKQQGGSETETEYFAALMSTLEVSTTVQNLSAVVRLLSLVIRKVPKEVLINRCSQVLQLLLETLTKHADSLNVNLIRGLLGCISHVLRVQPASVWSQPELTNVYQCLLTYTTHTKPKIRKAGQHAIISVVRGGEMGDNTIHPAASQAGQHCIDVIKSAGPGDNSILYMMLLLRGILPGLPKNMTKQCCETLLKLLTLGSKVVISTGFSSLYGLFSERPGSSTLPADLNAQLITALYDYKPNLNDPGPIIAWLAVQQEGILNLTQQNPQLSHAHLHRFCAEAASCWVSEKPNVVKSAGLALRAVISEAMNNIPKDTCAKVIEEVSNGLKYQFHRAWPTVLSVLGHLVEAVGGQHPKLLYPLLRSIADMHNSDNVKLEKEIDAVMGKAIGSMGPREVLEAVPLNITGEETDNEFTRSWMLPVLRESISRTDLAFFQTNFLPLADKFLARSQNAEDEGDRIGYRTYAILSYQVWSLLPGFCKEPKDLTTSFKNLAKILGTQLASRKEIRLDILSGLRHLITSSLEIPENKAELSRFAKNFLPILFNLYSSTPSGSEEAGQRLAALETIKSYLKVSDATIIESMFDRALEKANDIGSDEFTKEAVMDILRCLLNYIDVGRVETMYEFAKLNITSLDWKAQKKSYKILEEICKCETDASKQFLDQNLESLESTLLTSLSKSGHSSQYPRLKCLVSIISKLKTPRPDFAVACIPEAVLCISAVNQKAREFAFVMLTCVAEAMIRWNPDQQDEVLRQFANKVMEGLTASPKEVKCAIFALCKLYHQFKDIIPQDVIYLILKNVLTLMGSSSRDIALATISFVKVFVVLSPLVISTKLLPNIMKGLTEMPDDCMNHSRTKMKFLLERLVRKFGFDLVASLVPKSDIKLHKRLRNIKKEAARSERKDDSGKGALDGDEDEFNMGKSRQKTMEDFLADSSDDEFDDDECYVEGVTKSKRKKQKDNAFIQEGDDILDLLSSKAAASISTTRPTSQAEAEAKQNKRKVAKKNVFKISSDGRIVIDDKMAKTLKFERSDDDDDDEMDDGGLDDKDRDDYDDDKDGEETFESLVATKKRKIGSETASVKSRMSGASKRSGYTTGGSGIHRDLNSAPGSEYRSKKSRGDLKVAGKPDPYAYIPMTHKSLNKRKSAGLKQKSVFKNVVRGAKKGAAKGAKFKVKDLKKKH